MAADNYQAMSFVEQRLSLPEDRLAKPPQIGQLMALVDALRGSTLNPAQIETLRALRVGLVALSEQLTMGDVKVRNPPGAVDARTRAF